MPWRNILRLISRGFGGDFPGNFQGGAPLVDLVEIRPGRGPFPRSFMMGSPEEERGRWPREGPRHEVRFNHAFALGRTPVTFAEFDRFCDATGWERPKDLGWGRDRRPVLNVSYWCADAYCAWLSGAIGRPYRLPSEAEWEYACRAGTTGRYWFGEDDQRLARHAWFFPNAGGTTQPVGAEGHANPWGLSDMHGNVWEWCADCWNSSYEGAPTDGRAWLTGDCAWAPVRCGAWNGHPQFLRSAARSRSQRTNRVNYFGFRVARTL